MDNKQRIFETLCRLIKQLDPEVFEPLLAHQSKILNLNIHNLVSLTIQIQGDSLLLMPDHPAPTYHTQLSGSLSDFIFASQPNPASLRQGNLTLKGDLAFAQSFSDCLKQMDCDWEGFFSDKVGDHVAHFGGKFLKTSAAYFKELFQRRATDLVYYLQDEKQFAPYPDEIQTFCDEVDKLKCDVERFEIKFKSLL